MSEIITDLAWLPPAFPAQGRLPTQAALVGTNCAQQDNHELAYRQELCLAAGRRVEPPCCKTLHISLFFDGTGNNLNHDLYIADPKHPTNIARLFRATIGQGYAGGLANKTAELLDASGSGEDKYYKYYIPGVGTPFPEVNDLDFSMTGLAAASRITSGQDLLAQARTLTEYLREQPDGWLAAHRLMKSLRHDTLSAIPAPDAQGKTRIEPPRADQRAMLKRLYLQQSWLEILEQADSAFSRGANHLWLDLQWYIHQALIKSGQDVLADIIAADLKGLLRRLTGLETLAFNDGTPFADEVTLNWINQNVLDDMSGWRDESVSGVSETGNDILALEPEALEKADTDGLDATLHWLQTRPGTDTTKDKWLLRLLMARVAEQKGKNELALHLLGELDSAAQSITLTQWTPALLFEVKSRRLRLLRMKATRSETDKSRLQPEMDQLLAGLIALDPASSAVLCG